MNSSWQKRWTADWRRAPLSGRIILIVAALVWGAAYIHVAIGMAATNTPIYTWHDALTDAFGTLLVVIFWAVIPFRIASAVQRRGGAFTPWALGGSIFGGFVVGLFYLAKYHRQPILEDN